MRRAIAGFRELCEADYHVRNSPNNGRPAEFPEKEGESAL